MSLLIPERLEACGREALLVAICFSLKAEWTDLKLPRNYFHKGNPETEYKDSSRSAV